jgi:hypothetical protein
LRLSQGAFIDGSRSFGCPADKTQRTAEARKVAEALRLAGATPASGETSVATEADSGNQPEAKHILALADDITNAARIQFHSGDREPGSKLTERGRELIVEGLRLLAQQKKAGRDTWGARSSGRERPAPGSMRVT